MDVVGTSRKAGDDSSAGQVQKADSECVDEEVREYGEQLGEETASTEDLMALVKRQGHCCCYCRDDLAPEESHLDHIIPRSRGGSDAVENLQWLCQRCNKAKGEMSGDEFVALCRKIAERR